MIRQQQSECHLQVALLCIFDVFCRQRIKTAISAYNKLGYTVFCNMLFNFGRQVSCKVICSLAMSNKEASWHFSSAARRIHALCLECDIAINALANQCDIAPSTIYNMLNTKSQNPGIVSIQKICDGLEISVREFFDDPLFENLKPEIK